LDIPHDRIATEWVIGSAAEYPASALPSTLIASATPPGESPDSLSTTEAAMPSVATPLPTQTDPRHVDQHAELVARLPELRGLLTEHRRFRLDQLDQLTAQLAQGPAGQVDSLDTSADNARVEVSAAVEAAAHLALDDIEAALARMDAGRYGCCAECDAAIPVERLFAIPQAPLCMRCQQRAEHFR
jgi:RNA polymerase-binding transcription factor DksA